MAEQSKVFQCPYEGPNDGATFLVRIRMGEIIKYVSSYKNDLRYSFTGARKKRYALILEKMFAEKPLLKKLVMQTHFGGSNYAALITRLTEHGA